MSWVEVLLGDIVQIYLHKTYGHGWHDVNKWLYGLINVRLNLDVIFAGIVEDIEALPELPKISRFWLILRFTAWILPSEWELEMTWNEPCRT